MSKDLEGYAALMNQFKDLKDVKKDKSAILRAAVTEPMKAVEKAAKANISAVGVSPGKKDMHRTYRGRLVTRGFALRSIRLRVKILGGGTAARATLGVLKEAYYALQFHELGTAKIPRRPWLVPAFESSRDTTVRAVGDAIKKRIEKIIAKRSGAAK